MYEYDILKEEWKTTNSPMLEKRSDPGCLKLNQEEIIVVGGYGETAGLDEEIILKSSEIYNIKHNSWRPGPDLPKGIKDAQFVNAKPGFRYSGYLIGGKGDDGHSSEIYGLIYGSDALDTFKKIGDIKRSRRLHVAMVLPENTSQKCDE